LQSSHNASDTHLSHLLIDLSHFGHFQGLAVRVKAVGQVFLSTLLEQEPVIRNSVQPPMLTSAGRDHADICRFS
jgi:hypothetical protein